MNNHNLPNNYTTPEVKIIFICTERLFAASTASASASHEDYYSIDLFE